MVEFLMPHMDWEPLIEAAWKVRGMAHAPYSKFHVGAALLVEGRIFSGCNVENLSFGLTMCAERVAVGTAVAAGLRRIEAVAVVADTSVPVSPCGACRQVLAEFGDPLVCLVNRRERVVFRLSELLPRASAGILDRPERS
jgi:cytidine deaminase